MSIPLHVPLWQVAAIMRFAIDLDGQSPFEADEIQHNVADRMLPAEFVHARAFAELSPDQNLWQISRSALSFGDFEGGIARDEYPSTTGLRPAVPLPIPGRCLARGTHQQEPL